MADPKHQAKYYTYSQIHAHGAIGNLNEGVVIQTHGLHTRLIAWPGNGFQTESVHVLTLKPGEESASYAYTIAEEVMICAAGRGECFFWGGGFPSSRGISRIFRKEYLMRFETLQKTTRT